MIRERYWINVKRRGAREADADSLPYVAIATRDDGQLIAVQFGARPGVAFELAWGIVQDDREREGVRGEAVQ